MQRKDLADIPGVVDLGHSIQCAWDSVSAVATTLAIDLPQPPNSVPVALPQQGAERYIKFFKDKLRDYQREAVRFLVPRTHALLSDPMRSGKSAVALASATALDASRVLIVCPAIAKWVWADEIVKWLGESALILEGRAGTTARKVCMECGGRGCDECSHGSHIVRSNAVKTITLWKRAAGAEEPPKRIRTQHKVFNALSTTYEEMPNDTATQRALKLLQKSGYVQSVAEQRALPGIHDAIQESKWIICNYDILTAQQASTASGKVFTRKDLGGWTETLKRHKFDIAIGDEIHLIRGVNRTATRRGKTRRDRFIETVAHIPYVWGVTGTPIYGFVRDLWGQLDAISGGLFGDVYKFEERYCDGHRGEWGWKADGKSALAETELRPRLQQLMIKRPRAIILDQMPKKIRQVIRLDAPASAPQRNKFKLPTKAELRSKHPLSETFDMKKDAVIESVISEMADGAKLLVFTLLRASTEKFAKALDMVMNGSKHGVQMRAQAAKLWTAHGAQSDKVRFEMARRFREHQGAGVFVATIDSLQVAVNLAGATSVHFIDLHWSPSALCQAEDRAYDVDTKGVTVVYYIVKGSADEAVQRVVLPKLETVDRMTNEEGAHEMHLALSNNNDPEKDIMDILDSLAAMVDGDDVAWEEREP